MPCIGTMPHIFGKQWFYAGYGVLISNQNLYELYMYETDDDNDQQRQKKNIQTPYSCRRGKEV